MTSEKQKLLDKLVRKDKRRVAKGRAGADADVDWLMAHGFDALVEAEILRDTEGQVLARLWPFCHAACCSCLQQPANRSAKICLCHVIDETGEHVVVVAGRRAGGGRLGVQGGRQ